MQFVEVVFKRKEIMLLLLRNCSAICSLKCWGCIQLHFRFNQPVDLDRWPTGAKIIMFRFSEEWDHDSKVKGQLRLCAATKRRWYASVSPSVGDIRKTTEFGCTKILKSY
eukprot:GHVU01183067.1.p1 GENE.GHVU01183067.1~~GHVU01183067.1.p1  ORF type:complete len:110 (-),score=6.08 GHVU01183067.1:730-1059(-)